MTPKEAAEDLIDRFLPHTKVYHEATGWEDYFDSAKECALIAVQITINANPHSNRFNTNVYSTMDYWQQVKQEIEKL